MKHNIKSIKDLNTEDKKVFLRADLNVPMQNDKITDTKRIDETLQTVDYLIKQNAKIIIASHLGRPGGEKVPELSLKPIAEYIKSKGYKITFSNETIGDKVKTKSEKLGEGEILLLENLRFHKEEKQNGETFAKDLSNLAEVYVNDAFSVCHRAHASVYALPKLMSQKGSGCLLQKEITALGQALDKPKRPLTAIIAGAKISTKLALIDNIIDKVDAVIIGGAMANTFLKAKGYEIGTSLVEDELLGIAKKILNEAQEKQKTVFLPTDAMIADKLAENQTPSKIDIKNVPTNKMILDIGPKTAAAITKILSEANTLLWNGPLGAFEISPFDEGSKLVAKEAARLTKSGKLITIAGGGDTAAMLDKAGYLNDLSYVSLAGGAFLEYIEGKSLPGLKALES
jgi:phosphoglycerate kinase